MRAGAQRIPGPKTTVETDLYRESLRADTSSSRSDPLIHFKGILMNSIIYIVGLIVVIIAVLSFFGLR